MKKKLICKCLLTLGLLLFFTILLPNYPSNTVIAKAASTEKDKSDNYRLNLKSITLIKDKSFTLKVYNVDDKAKVYFKSDDKEIASVNDDGVISANKVGTTNINAIIRNGADSASLTCEVTVGPPAVSVKFTQSKIILGLNDSEMLSVILKPSNTAEDAKFSAEENQNKVSISPGGRVSADKYGMAYVFTQINAENSDGNSKYDRCIVIVTSKDNVSKLENYFTEHTELYKISENDLDNALYTFFNENTDKADSSSLVDSLDRYLSKNLK